ncbi:MAG TPA: hypothetical protein VMH24_05600 [Candidatus Sulfotelmatobacter sp.]|nr:hypothetical protein [Candidatus Sulfotelmatobacter sp.]
MGFQNPAITGRAIINALDPETATADHREASAEQSALDEADLRAVERDAYYEPAPASPDGAAPAPHRNRLARLLRR